MRVYRLTLPRYVDTAFSGEGARRVGGRWTPPGRPVVVLLRVPSASVPIEFDCLLNPRHPAFGRLGGFKGRSRSRSTSACTGRHLDGAEDARLQEARESIRLDRPGEG